MDCKSGGLTDQTDQNAVSRVFLTLQTDPKSKQSQLYSEVLRLQLKAKIISYQFPTQKNKSPSSETETGGNLTQKNVVEGKVQFSP